MSPQTSNIYGKIRRATAGQEDGHGRHQDGQQIKEDVGLQPAPGGKHPVLAIVQMQDPAAGQIGLRHVQYAYRAAYRRGNAVRHVECTSVFFVSEFAVSLRSVGGVLGQPKPKSVGNNVFCSIRAFCFNPNRSVVLLPWPGLHGWREMDEHLTL